MIFSVSELIGNDGDVPLCCCFDVVIKSFIGYEIRKREVLDLG